MRISEALDLRLDDVDLDQGVLTVRSAKLGRLRLVPLHPSTCAVLANYLKRREQFWGNRGNGHVFVSNRGTRLDIGRVHRTFYALSRQIGLRAPGASKGPRLHDFRHRIDGVIRTQAVLIAIGVSWEGRREVLAVSLANRESGSSWKDFLVGLRERGLQGVEFVVSDDHHGIKAALREVLPEAAWQRCYVHFLRNALDHLPRKGDDDCLQELRWLYDRRDLKEAQQDLCAWLKRWEGRYPRLTDWVEAHIGETLTFYRLPRQHHKHLKSTNMLERLNEEIKRRTRVVRIFPNPESCLRLVLALCVETHETWLEDHRCLNMDLLKEQKKAALRQAAQSLTSPMTTFLHNLTDTTGNFQWA